MFQINFTCKTSGENKHVKAVGDIKALAEPSVKAQSVAVFTWTQGIGIKARSD